MVHPYAGNTTAPNILDAQLPVFINGDLPFIRCNHLLAIFHGIRNHLIQPKQTNFAYFITKNMSG